MRVFKALFSISYFLLLFYAVFLAPRRLYVSERFLNIIPVTNTIRSYDYFKNNNQLYHFYSNLFGNFLLLIPFSFFLISVVGLESNRSIFFWTLFVSFTIEVIQLSFKRGVADIDDVILNILGALLATVLYKKIRLKI